MHHASSRSGTASDHRDRVRMRTARIALVLLAAAALYQGLWAQLAPRSFYESFPGGVSWLVGDGPYNEHFVRDIGGLVNGLAVVAALSAWSLSRRLVVANAAGWLTYAVPHLVFHVVHPLDGAAMQGLNVVVLCSEIAFPLVGLWGIRRDASPGPTPGGQRRTMHSTPAS
jgi:hypothetical protein